MEAAYSDKQKAFVDWQDAVDAQKEAYKMMKDHGIGHDEFEKYLEDTACKKEEFQHLNEIFQEKKAEYEREKEAEYSRKNKE